MACGLSVKEYCRVRHPFGEVILPCFASPIEAVFLIDRSNSMEGAGIEQAREALLEFLDILPNNSCFNVVSFGRTFVSMFSGSQPSSDGWSLGTARTTAKSMTANFHGKDLLTALRAVLRETPKRGYRKQVFVLTDGQVDNNEEVRIVFGRL